MTKKNEDTDIHDAARQGAYGKLPGATRVGVEGTLDPTGLLGKVLYVKGGPSGSEFLAVGTVTDVGVADRTATVQLFPATDAGAAPAKQ